MGLINITFRREQLGNIGSTGMAHGVTDTNIGTVHHTVARRYNPTYFNKQASKGWSSLAKGLEALGEVPEVLGAIQKREDEKKSDELVTHVVDHLDRMDRDERTFTPEEIGGDKDRAYLLGTKDEEGNYSKAQQRGLFLRTGEGTKHLVQEADASYGETFNRLAEEMGASDEAKRKAHLRLAAYQRGRVRYALDTQAKEYRRMELEGAKNQLTKFLSAYANGNVNTLDDIFAAKNKLGMLEGKSGDTRQLEEEALAYSLAEDAVSRTCESFTEGKQFDDLISFLEKNGPEGKLDTVFSEKLTSRLADGGKIGGTQLKKLTQRIATARDYKARETKSAAARATEQVFKGYQNEFDNISYAIMSPDQATVDKAMDALDEKAFRRRIDDDRTLNTKQRLELAKTYATFTSYRDKYREAQKEHNGFYTKDGRFINANSFNKKTDDDVTRLFADRATWQDPKGALAKLEGARQAGRLSKEDWAKWKSKGEMLLEKDAEAWWEKTYGKLELGNLLDLKYGEGKVDNRVKAAREKAGRVPVGGIFAAKKGVKKSYANAADFVTDTLSKDEDGSEELIPADVLVQVYDTVKQYAACGVDPADAVRALLQPALKSGIRMSLEERLKSVDYMKEVRRDFLTNGTHFATPSATAAETGRGTNWYADVNQARSANLKAQGRLATKDNGTKEK